MPRVALMWFIQAQFAGYFLAARDIPELEFIPRSFDSSPVRELQAGNAEFGVVSIDPEKQLYVILLTNRVNPTRDHSRIGPVRVAVADAAMRMLHPAVVAAIEARPSSTSPSPKERP